jgi:RNA polymerase sigma factor (sigma-70 family)
LSLTTPELARQLDRLRPAVIASKRRLFPRLSIEDLEDAYSQVVEEILRRRLTFDTDTQLAAYLHKALTNRARDITRSGAYRTAPLALTDDSPFAAADRDDPGHHALAGQARERLREFLAEISEQDRTIAYLYLDPGHDWTPRQIAAELKLPKDQIESSVNRTRTSFSRFTAQAVRPGAICNRRRSDVLEWQQTGVIPRVLRIHMSYCHSCRMQHRGATDAVRAAILPLIPAAALPLTTAGALSRLYHSAGAHPTTQRLSQALTRWRKLAPVGGGGGAAIAAKLAATTAVITATAALGAVDSNHTPHHHHHHHRLVAHLAAATTPATSAPAQTPAISQTVTTPTVQTLTAATTSTPTPTVATSTTTTATTTTVATPPPPNENTLAVSGSAGDQTATATSESGPPPTPNENSAPTATNNANSSTKNSSSASANTLPAPSGPPPP